jgi:hypothetical protein
MMTKRIVHLSEYQGSMYLCVAIIALAGDNKDWFPGQTKPIVAANNHYAGFGPGTAYMFRKMLDLSEMTWNDVEITNTGENASSKTKLSSLSDFLKWA